MCVEGICFPDGDHNPSKTVWLPDWGGEFCCIEVYVLKRIILFIPNQDWDNQARPSHYPLWLSFKNNIETGKHFFSQPGKFDYLKCVESDVSNIFLN